MRHIGEELGLVFRGQRQLLGLFLERLPRLLDFLILAFDLLVLMRQQLRLFLKLALVCLQLSCAALQLVGERLRLLQQFLGAHIGFDRVDDDADALGEEVEKRLVRRVEALKAAELDARP